MLLPLLLNLATLMMDKLNALGPTDNFWFPLTYPSLYQLHLSEDHPIPFLVIRKPIKKTNRSTITQFRFRCLPHTYLYDHPACLRRGSADLRPTQVSALSSAKLLAGPSV